MCCTRAEPPTEGSAEGFYSAVMEMHSRAFTDRRFEASYHLLAAALHFAEEMDSVERLDTILRLCSDRQAEARNSAQFVSLAATTKAVIGRIGAGRALKRNREILDAQKESNLRVGAL
jgi:hypothetical protein